jgi:4-hydroxyphenylpyruvate dioxygenase-like putative hemolysin
MTRREGAAMKNPEAKDADSAERLNVGRIDHIVLAYQNRENLDKAREEFSALLGVEDWEDLGEIEEVRLQIWISWKAGLELICPTGAGSFVDEHLSSHGEGFFSMVFGVADLSRAMERVKDRGGNAVALAATPPDGAVRRYAVTREAVLGKVGGIEVLLGEFSLRHPEGS